MTQEYDPAYLDNLVVVAADDVAVLRAKEATYRGSWKKRGGIGAYMMLVRNFDRLEGMLSPKIPAERGGYSYDVFAAIAADTSGRDGTVLACVRDARRYLMLVEAEMMQLGVVRPEMLPPGPPVATVGLAAPDRGAGRSPYRDDPNCEPLEKTRAPDLQYEMPYGGATGTQLLGLAVAWGSSSEEAYERLVRIAGTRYDPVRALMRKWVKDEAGVIAELKLSRREDSNRHALQDHGEITRDTRVNIRAPLTPPDPRQFRHDDRYEDGLTVEEYRKSGTPYVCDAGSDQAVVDRGVLPEDDCGHLPRLSLEQNHKEWTDLPIWYRWMYYWTGEKYRLKDTYHQRWGQL